KNKRNACVHPCACVRAPPPPSIIVRNRRSDANRPVSRAVAACECNPFGSASDRCNGTGQCECKEGASGLKCGECLAGYYWNRGCQQNACDEELLRCQNGGECRDRQRCACAPGYSGALCEERSGCRGRGAGCGGS
uniref:EGF-like domain-containing protein n=1 Tax=Petromyzon marinus TaxID=7757 RepID=S4R5M9_PETMA